MANLEFYVHCLHCIEDYYSFPLSNLYVFFMYYHNFPNFLRTLYRFKRVTYLSPGILLLLCDKYDRDVDSQASLKISELGRGSWFWSESSNEDKKDSLGATRPHALSPLLSYLSIYAISPATGKGKLPVCKWVTSNESPSFQCKINVTSNLRSLHHSLFPPAVPTRPQGVTGQLPPGVSSNEHYCGDENDDDYGSFFFPFNFVNLIALSLY